MIVNDKSIIRATRVLFSKLDPTAKVKSVQVVPGHKFYTVVITVEKKHCG
jgi:hypothetical protein